MKSFKKVVFNTLFGVFLGGVIHSASASTVIVNGFHSVSCPAGYALASVTGMAKLTHSFCPEGLTFNGSVYGDCGYGFYRPGPGVSTTSFAGCLSIGKSSASGCVNETIFYTINPAHDQPEHRHSTPGAEVRAICAKVCS